MNPKDIFLLAWAQRRLAVMVMVARYRSMAPSQEKQPTSFTCVVPVSD